MPVYTKYSEGFPTIIQQICDVPVHFPLGIFVGMLGEKLLITLAFLAANNPNFPPNIPMRVVYWNIADIGKSTIQIPLRNMSSIACICVVG